MLITCCFAFSQFLHAFPIAGATIGSVRPSALFLALLPPCSSWSSLCLHAVVIHPCALSAYVHCLNGLAIFSFDVSMSGLFACRRFFRLLCAILSVPLVGVACRFPFICLLRFSLTLARCTVRLNIPSVGRSFSGER